MTKITFEYIQLFNQQHFLTLSDVTSEDTTDMFGIENYPLFLSTGILLNITPGADTLYILSRSITQGRSAGVWSVLGIASGAVIHTTLAAFGLSSLCSRSPLIFTLISFLGSGYLLYLGITTILRAPVSFSPASTQQSHRTTIVVYRQGFLTNLLNPKVALFFVAFMPQFINPQYAQKAIPFLLLGATFITTGTIWCMALALFASRLTIFFRRNKRINNLLTISSGIVFIGLGIRLLFVKL